MKSSKNVLLLVIFFLTVSSCDIYNSLRFGALPSQKDYPHFPQRKILNGGPVFNFTKPDHDYNLGQSIGLTNRSLNATNVYHDSFVLMHKTISFLIIRNDSNLFEKYNDDYSDTSLVSSFFMVKPIISTLIGRIFFVVN